MQTTWLLYKRTIGGNAKGLQSNATYETNKPPPDANDVNIAGSGESSVCVTEKPVPRHRLHEIKAAGRNRT